MSTTNFASSFSAQCSYSAGNASAGLSGLEVTGNTGELSHLSPSRTSGSDIGRDGSAGGAALFETVCTSIQNLVGCCACILSIDDRRSREFRVSYIQGISGESAEKILKKCLSAAVPVCSQSNPKCSVTLSRVKLAVEIGGNLKNPEYCIEGHILQITVDRDDEGTHTLSLVRKNASQPFRAREIKALGHVVPMIRILLRKEKRLVSSRSFNSVSWNILNQLSLGIILIDTNGHVTAANQAAVMLFEAANHFILTRGRIACVRTSDNEALRAALLELAASDVLLNRTMRVSDARGMEYLNLLMIRVDDDNVELGENRRNLALFVTAPNMFRGPSEKHIQDFYGLTRVEAAVVRLLCLGYDPTTTAKELRVSVNTIRGYLKNVFQKMGVRRQSDMVRVAMCYSGVFADPTSKSPFVGRKSQVTTGAG